MKGGIKRNLHAFQAIWPQTLVWTIDNKGAVVKACYDAITKGQHSHTLRLGCETGRVIGKIP